jgi:hypothetical protein
VIRIPYAQLPSGAIITVARAAEEEVWYRDYGCTSCGAALRLHRQRVPHGPRDHFEHRQKPERCEYLE